MDPLLGALGTTQAAQPPEASGIGAAPGAGAAAASDGDTSFQATLEQVLGEVSSLEQNRHEAIHAFLNGEPVELHQVMAAVEEAGIALDALVELRNKLTEAYHTVINMQS